MKSFVVLSALILAVCVVSGQCKKFARNTNTNINTNTNDNSNGDFLSSFLNSMMDQERKSKAIASRGLAAVVPAAQQEEDEQEQATDVVEAPSADETIADETVEPRQERSSAISSAQLKFFKSLMAAKAQKFEQSILLNLWVNMMSIKP